MKNIKRKKTTKSNQNSNARKNRVPSSSRHFENKKSKNFNGEAITGRIQGNPNGFAFLIRDDLGPDVFISPNSLNGAIHGDKVKANVRQREGGNTEAIVIELIEATSRIFVGTYVQALGGRGFVVPDEKRISSDIEIEYKNSLEVKNGDRVLVKLIARKDKLIGRLTRVFKESEKIDWDILSVILEHNLKEEFDELVLRDVAKISDALSDNDLRGRNDFRNSIAVTIDGDDSRDFDDAVSLIKKTDGYELTVHIADVSHYVKQGSLLDKEAFIRGTSVYFPGSFIPMLPEKICNNVCSLMEDHDRLTLSVIMQINKNGKVTKHKITNGVIRSKRRMTYNLVEKILDGDKIIVEKYSDVATMLLNMKELALILNKRRKERGAVDFELPETEILFNEDGTVGDVRRAARLTSHRIIEEFMLITNETVAEFMHKELAPFVYRGHLPPNDLKMDTFTDFLSAMGITWDKSEPIVPMDYSCLLSKLPENLKGIVNMMALRSMTKAAYFPQNKGHFGLAAEFYCHFTAPIRRYPDLLIHRIIKNYLISGKKCFNKYTQIVSEASLQSSLTERQADEVERDVEDIYKARFMSDKIGETYEGIISGITDFGIFVQLENTIEGLVKKESLPGGDYSYNPIIMSLSNISRSYKLGDSMKIKVLSVNKTKIEFEQIE